MSLSNTSPKKKRQADEELLVQIRNRCCVVCLGRPVDASHIRSRGAGGPDKEFNVVAKCRRHHVEWHQYGWQKFCELYPKFEHLLNEMGWKVIAGKLWHESLLDD